MQQQVRNRALSDARKKAIRELNGVPEGWMTSGGAAEYLNVNDHVVYRLMRSGQLQGQKFGELTCFTKEMLDEYDARRRKLSIVQSEPDTPSEPEAVPETPEESTPEQEQEPETEHRPWYAEPLPEAPTRLKWNEVQQLATIGKTKKVELSSGLIYLL